MHLTEASLAAGYEMLRSLPPFARWALPPAHEVRFRVLRTRRVMGDYGPDEDGTHVIRVSERRHGRLSSVLGTLAHEMCHLRLDVAGARDTSEHGEQFRALARQVVKRFPDFDLESF